MLVILYLFLGGCGGGLLFVATTGSLLFYRSMRRTQEATRVFARLMKHCYALGLLLVLFAAACLVIDLGQPVRMYLLFTRPTTSVLSYGSFILLATMLLSFLLTSTHLLNVLRMSSNVKNFA